MGSTGQNTPTVTLLLDNLLPLRCIAGHDPRPCSEVQRHSVSPSGRDQSSFCCGRQIPVLLYAFWQSLLSIHAAFKSLTGGLADRS